MSDRVAGFTVVLEDTVRDESAEKLKEAILLLKGVRFVGPVVATPELYIAREQARLGVLDDVWRCLRPPPPAEARP